MHRHPSPAVLRVGLSIIQTAGTLVIFGIWGCLVTYAALNMTGSYCLMLFPNQWCGRPRSIPNDSTSPICSNVPAHHTSPHDQLEHHLFILSRDRTIVQTEPSLSAFKLKPCVVVPNGNLLTSWPPSLRRGDRAGASPVLCSSRCFEQPY